MNIAIFSDIHGNKYAFKKALEIMNTYDIKHSIFCGDAVGYYYHHNDVIDMLGSIPNLHSVLGNHDKMFLDFYNNKVPLDDYTDKYGQSALEFVDSVNDHSFVFLSELSKSQVLQIDNLSFLINHGSPWNELEGYIYPDYNFDHYQNIIYDFIIQGHTHYPMKIDTLHTTIINPGSIGQPRDGNQSSFAILDTKSKNVEFIQFKYDVKPLIMDIKKRKNEPRYLIDIIRRSFDEKED